jgi:hypothetical protein
MLMRHFQEKKLCRNVFFMPDQGRHVQASASLLYCIHKTTGDYHGFYLAGESGGQRFVFHLKAPLMLCFLLG